MMTIRTIAIACVISLAACSSGSTLSNGTIPNVPAAHQDVAKTTFVFAKPTSSSSTIRKPAYVTASIQSVTIALNTVNGSAPPAGLTTSVTTNLTLSACPCAVPGPNVPPGSDSFTITTYDGLAAAGNVVSTASATFSIVVGQNNSNNVTLSGVPASFAITSVPSGTAGTAFVSPQAFALAVKDADGNTILGTYSTPVTLTDSDVSSLAQGSSLSLNGGSASTLITVGSSSDTVALGYGGLAIAPATLTAAATGATSATATFTPALQPIVYSGPLNGVNPEIDLYAVSGTGSTGTFTASEAGWTNSPYNKSFTKSLSAGCSTIATASPSSGTSFTVTSVASPSAGTCTLTLSGGVSQTKAVTLTYTAFNLGVQ